MEAGPGDIDPETGEQSIAPVRVSAPKPKPRRQPGHRPAPGWGGHPYSHDPQIARVAGSRIAGVGDRRSGRPADCQSEGLTEFVTFPAVSTWSVSADIRMRKNAGMVLTHPMAAASSADIPWQCVRQIAKGGCQGRRQNVPLGRCRCSRIGPYSHWPVQSLARTVIGPYSQRCKILATGQPGGRHPGLRTNADYAETRQA